MVLYICYNCNKEFKKKCNFYYHIENKKRPCTSNNITNLLNLSLIPPISSVLPPISSVLPPISSDLSQNNNNNNNINLNSNLSISSDLFKNNTDINLKNNPISQTNHIEQENEDTSYLNSNNLIDILMNKPSITDNDKKCIYCDKIFTRIDNLQRHQNGRCKSKMNYDDLEKLKEDVKIIIKNYQKLENNYLNLENNYQNLENVNVNLKKEIDGIKINQQGSYENIKNINNAVNNNNNNNQINKGVILNNTVNIQVVQFGSEDIDKLNLTDAMKSYLKSTGGNIASNMLSYINLNKDYPENNNICMTDMSREIVKMHNGKKFVYKKFKNVKGDILNKVVGNTRKLINKYKNDESLKKSNDTKNKLKINDVSLKIIDGISAEDIVREEINENEKHLIKNKIKCENENSESEEEREFTFEERLRIEHLEKKREGMQKITYENIKDGLYNAKELMEKIN